MDADILIRVDHLQRRYGANLAVDDISFEVRRGEVLGFLGPNGAGKSTAMNIIAGTLAPSGGQVLVGGVDILDRPREAKRQIGYLPEQPPLYREMTVNEFLLFAARLHGVARNAIHTAVQQAKARCGLEQVGGRLIANLSKGFQQRVGIAQAIVHMPAVVILDEPTVGLDPIQIQEIRALIRELGGEHSVILSSHILTEVQSVCDHVQIINEGRLILDQALDQLAQGPRHLKLGLRQPPPLAELETLPGVSRVEALSSGHLRVHYADDQDPSDALVRSAVARGWGLFELTPQETSLEEVFLQLTRGDLPTATDTHTPGKATQT